MSIVTLTSDFGTPDGFVASMKGVLLSVAPEVRLVDATHEIAPGDVEAGAWVLGGFWKLYPLGTVHLAVVDPGVGSARRALALSVEGRFVVAPDNGLVHQVLEFAESWRCFEIHASEYLRASPSPTFHGRDVFAPAAAHLAGGLPVERLGPPLTDPVRLTLDPPVRQRGAARGRVAHIDRFGNLISDIPGEWVGEGWRFEVGGVSLTGLSRTYSDVPEGAAVVVIGSRGTVEVAVHGASAAAALGVVRGDPVTAAAPC